MKWCFITYLIRLRIQQKYNKYGIISQVEFEEDNMLPLSCEGRKDVSDKPLTQGTLKIKQQTIATK